MVRRVAVLVSGLALVAAGSQASAALPQHPGAARQVPVAGASVNLRCTGSGSPTVVLMAGFGDKLKAWHDIQSRLSRHHRVCSYDRLGEGASSKPGHTMTLARNTHLLHGLLAKAGESGPLVVVGHSIGGDLAVAYARAHRHQTRGVVTFDATPPGYLNQVLRIIPGSATGVLAALRGEAVAVTSGKNQEKLRVRGSGWATKGSLGRTPVAAVEHGLDIFSVAGTYAARLQHRWASGQRDLSKVSHRSQLIIATRSGHYIYQDQPRLALDVINAVIAQAGG